MDSNILIGELAQSAKFAYSIPTLFILHKLSGVWLFSPPTVCPPPVFPPWIVHRNETSIMRGSHRYNASPPCKRYPMDSPLKTTTERLPLALGGESNARPLDKKAIALPLVPSMHVSLDHSRQRQSKWLGCSSSASGAF